MTIRFAILAGVSTDAQNLPNKRSIPEQIDHCRNIIAQHGIETVEPFIMDGYSRTGYDSLDVAMHEIPPLGSAVRAAMDDQYDILIMDNFERLGDLGLIVKTRFKKYRKQLYSARQSGRVVPPELYDPYATESTDIDMHVEGIIQSYRINKIRRGWQIGVPDRARNGLHPLTLTFGYRLTGKNQPAEQVPEHIALIIMMKNWLLEGRTLTEISRLADATGILPRRSAHWHPNKVRRILANPYYAGIIHFRKYRLNPEKKRLPLPPSQWITGKGKHVPIWDEATYQAILDELERREGLRARSQTYALSGLLTCSRCGGRLHRHGKVDSRFPVELVCPSVPAHVIIRYDVALKIVAGEMVKQLKKRATMPPARQTEAFEKHIAELEEQRTLVQQGYIAKIYSQDEASRLIVAIETDIEKATAARNRAAHQDVQAAALLKLAQQDLDKIHDWILHSDDPTKVNHLLTTLCQTITITPMYELQVIWR